MRHAHLTKLAVSLSVLTALGCSEASPDGPLGLQPQFAVCGTPPCGKGENPKRASFALSFDGLQQHTFTPDASDLDLSTTWTLEAWINPSDVNRSAFQHVISKWAGGGDASYTLEVHEGRLRSGIHNGIDPTQAVESLALLRNDVWQHVAITLDNGTLRLFIDGELDRTVTGSQTPMNSTRPLSLGREGPPFNGWHYAGLIDEVRIWKVARSPKEIARDMNKRPSGRPDGLVAYWRMKEGSGQIAADETGNGHDMQLGDTPEADAADPIWVLPGI